MIATCRLGHTIAKIPNLYKGQVFRMGTPKRSAANCAHFDVKEKSDLWCEQFSGCMPRLDSGRHKGDSGRIGVVGGCDEYTGAPHYAAMTALRCGADLVHIFSTPSAAQVLKCYGPEAIVLGVLGSRDIAATARDWLPRLHVIVLGPGLGRDPKVMESAASILQCARELSLPLVVDADGLWMVLKDPKLVASWPKGMAILTPNVVEFARFAKELGVASVDELAQKLGVTVVLKGQKDYVASPSGEVRVCESSGSGRRCGGQGDVLAGSMGLFLSWACRTELKDEPTLVAAYAACRLTRECNRKAFARFGRSMLTTDMIGEIHDAFHGLFEKTHS